MEQIRTSKYVDQKKYFKVCVQSKQINHYHKKKIKIKPKKKDWLTLDQKVDPKKKEENHLQNPPPTKKTNHLVSEIKSHVKGK